jgi:pyoverdine/dityrosine biosynthesis protein Dit1
MNTAAQRSIELAHRIIAILKEHRRSESCHHHEYHDCLVSHVNKLIQLISRNEIIRFVLPAFPAKSPNPSKTYGALPDLGEHLALCFLNHLCCSIKHIYSPGAEIIICSDGRVFNDLVGVGDHEVDAYSQKIRAILEDNNLTHITLFALDEHYGNVPYAEMRKNLIREFGETEARLKNTIKNCISARQQFNGIHRFIFEDSMFAMNTLSRNKIRKLSKEVAYQVVKRSNSWSVLVEKKFPDALRLSIHPQVCGSNKIGLMLLKAVDNWATPWHRVVLYDGQEHRLIKKNDAEDLGATPVFVNDKFSHYILKELHYVN